MEQNFLDKIRDLFLNESEIKWKEELKMKALKKF
jgi:hypothetical protein